MQQPVKVLVTGANGQLATEIRELATAHHEMIFDFAGRDRLPVTDAEAIQRHFEAFQPDYCINCAAYTAVDKAEEPGESEIAERINAIAVGHLARACTIHGTKFIHISTDYVFDGTASAPYKPEDATHPLSVYGATKLKGEQLAREHTDAVVIRTAWVYSSFGKNFVKTMIRLMNERPAISVVNDQLGAPTYARDLARAILDIIAAPHWIPGTYHYTNEGVISWYDFAMAIKEHIHSACVVNPIPSEAYPTPAKRPAYSVLDTTSIKEAYGVRTPYWVSSLTECIKILTR
ncbi:dTDP-4-dehydrorhamnose reductase [Niabella sp. CC-SYL272]|uniref:dTDP-4-dehydrorhamnose reductase n=1 Tax=Niabella agricola TaxID=2891571 RepID=UPI001F2D6644|nr:dTDP-4-dehydrorhamnose reductase [Niabella agricola]MCF3108591.1 dTDP-4-dehydrorhamnose reductase [Niabella agricola]